MNTSVTRFKTLSFKELLVSTVDLIIR